VARTASARVAGNCRHFTVLLVTLLRAQGTPARARCGFGGYFGTGTFEDHWVCEFWAVGQQRWVLADAQLDARQRDFFTIGFDVLDVPRDQFLVAGDAWARYRAGTADPGDFGLTLLHESGAWWIAANLIRDVAALCGMEMLPWDPV
jgi:transglutaminase-like putative cysteine protease